MYGLGFGVGAAGATTILKSGVAIDTDAQALKEIVVLQQMQTLKHFLLLIVR